MKKANDFKKFIIVTICAIICDFILYMYLSRYINITIAKLTSTSIVCFCQYFASKYFTFKSDDIVKEKNFIQIAKYIIAQVLNILTNIGTNKIVYEFSNKKVMAFIVATITATIVNYILQRYIVFKKNKEDL